MSIFKRLTGRHPNAAATDPQAAASPEKPPKLDKDPILKQTIFDIVKQGNVSYVFEKLVEGGTSLITELNDNKQTLLHVAAELGHLEVIKLLLLHRLVNIDAQDIKGQTPLHLAAHHRKLDVCTFLLERDADVTVTNIDGVPVLHFLVRCTFNDELRDILQLVISKGADKDGKDKYGESPLQRAAASLNLETVAWLLEQGADVNSANQFGETALHKATRMVHADEAKATKLIELLLGRGANPDVEGTHGSPLVVLSKKSQLVQDMFAKAREREKGKVSVKKKDQMVMMSQGSRLVTLPPDWAALDSKQKSEFLMSRWSSGAPRAAAAATPGTPGAADKAAAAPAAEASSSSDRPLSPRAPGADGDEFPAIADPGAGLASLSSAKLFVEEEKKERTATVSAEPAPPALPAGQVPVCAPADGYRVELGVPRDKPLSPRSLTLDFPPEYYKKHYIPNKHYNYVGYLNVKGEEKNEPAAISILMRFNEVLGFMSCLALIRTQLGNIEVPVRAPSANPTAAELIQELTLDKTKFSGNYSFCEVETPDLMFELLEYEKNDPQRCNCLPIGVIYVPRAGMQHLDIWAASNQNSSAFDQFLHLLGDKITLQGWSGYAGGLDTVYDKKGQYSIYTRWRGLEIMFHVSTLLPYVEHDHAKVQIARVIGNDITNIVFVEGEGSFNPATFVSAVTHVYGIVHPLPSPDGSPRYEVAVASKAFVPKFAPDLPPELTKENLKDYFLAKLVNGHFAAQRSKGLYMMYSRPRECLLRALVEQFDTTTPPPSEKKPEKPDKKKDKEKDKDKGASQKHAKRKSGDHSAVAFSAASATPSAAALKAADPQDLYPRRASAKTGTRIDQPRRFSVAEEQGHPDRKLEVSSKVDNLKGLLQADNAAVQMPIFASRSDTSVAASRLGPKPPPTEAPTPGSSTPQFLPE